MEQGTGAKPSKRRHFKARGGVKKEDRRGRSDRTEVVGNGISYEAHAHKNRWRKGHQKPLRTFILTGEEPTTLDKDLFSYLVKIQNDLQVMKVQPSTGEDNDLTAEDGDEVPPNVLLAQNALFELIPRLHEVSMDPTGSRVLQSLLRNVREPKIIAQVLENIVSLGLSRLIALAEHRCASHVLQDVFASLSSFPSSLILVRNSVTGLVRALEQLDFELLHNLIYVPSGSHVLRSIFGLLAGIPTEEPRIAKLDDSSPVPIRPYYEIGRVETPEEWHGAVLHCANLIISAPSEQVQMLPWSTSSCSALQSLISACTCISRALTKLLVKSTMGAQLSDLVFDASGSRFVERAVTCLGGGIVWDEVKGHLMEMIVHPKANHVLQRLFLRLSGRAQVKAAWDEVEQKLPDCLRFGSAREGVVLAMIRAAEAEGDDVMQRRASKCVAKALGATGKDSKNLVGAILTGSLSVWEKWRSDMETGGLTRIGIRGGDNDVLCLPRDMRSFNTVNVLIARSMLRFRGAAGQVARESMSSLTQIELLAILADSAGSRLLEQWIELDVKNNERVVRAILSEERCSVLATARCASGTMILSRCMPNVQQKLQKRVMDILASKVTQLKDDRFGSVVVRKCRVEIYSYNPEEWRDASAARATRARLFDDLFKGEENTVAGV